MIQVTCSNCGLHIQVPETVEGRQGICFACGVPMVIPMAANPAVTPDIQFNKGDRVAERYVIDSQIGKGGMGAVYKARDMLIDEEVALKFMHPKVLKTQRGQQLFIKEAQVARRLRHEHIVSVHDVSTTPEGVLYISMEFLNGLSLRDYLRQHRTDRKLLDVRFVINITLQVLSAMEYAHKMIVHRDLKPENIMLLPGETAKVLDFGLALNVDEDEDAVQADPSKKGRVIGTAVYASPEQHLHHSIDFRSDLYTMGLILHEMLTLRTPADEPVTIMEVRTDVAPSIVEIVHKAVNKDKDLRWQSARDFRKTLSESYDKAYKRHEVKEIKSASGMRVSTERMVYQDGGSFIMGCNDFAEERPEFEAKVEPFYIDQYPVTVEDYEQFLEATDHPKPKFWEDHDLNGPRQPANGVTLEDAMAYARWAGKLLPTERQWEFTARGRENRKYPWGNLEPDTTRCNFGDYLGMPSIVSMHENGATPEGVFDMAGNIHEWTLDGFVPYNPKNGGDNTQSKDPRRVVRGGSWHSTPLELRSTSRKGLFPQSQLTTVGFRCVLPASAIDPALDA